MNSLAEPRRMASVRWMLATSASILRPNAVKTIREPGWRLRILAASSATDTRGFCGKLNHAPCTMSVYSGFDADQLAERVCMNRLDQPCKTIFSMGIPFTVTRRTATYGTISGAHGMLHQVDGQGEHHAQAQRHQYGLRLVARPVQIRHPVPQVRGEPGRAGAAQECPQRAQQR